jgi:outer membrane receptor for ferrienterochelin and colicins
MKITILLAFLTLSLFCNAQTYYKVFVKDSKTKTAITDALVNIGAIGNSTDSSGFVMLTGIPDGRQPIHAAALGYNEQVDTLQFPMGRSDTAIIYLVQSEDEMEELIVNSTRSSRTIRDIPTRIELIAGDELTEKGNMKPGDIRMLLSESTGIQTLQTSATSGNSDIRIQGLDGRYTQILKDGFPLFAGFSGGLGLLQTPPLDLKRIEIIKGSSSTLYGGGAIAGLINLISKTPGTNRELSFLTNITTAKGVDVNAFYGQRFGKIGFTVYGAFDANAPYAPDNVVFTAIPRYTRYTFNPKVFIYPNAKTEISLGINTAFENRLGGDINFIIHSTDSLHTYYEANKTDRISSQLDIRHTFENGTLNVKNSVSYFKRIINTPGYSFDGAQASTFSEVSYAVAKKKVEWIAGANAFTDAFKEIRLTHTPLRDYNLITLGAFVQNTWDISPRFIMETGLRGDYVFNYGLALLPRLSFLYKINSALSSRLGGGLGYKAPTIFTEESERISYRDVLPITSLTNKLERSYGSNWDLNYKTTIADGAVRLSLNQLFFYTRLNEPLILTPVSNRYQFENLAAHIDALGTETNMRIAFKDFKLFLGYTFTHSHLHQGSMVTETPLTPTHHTNSVLMYEQEGKLKIGLEAYYYSPQRLSNGSQGRDYWLCGLMAEKIWKHFSVFINFENLLDSRQTRFGSIYTGSYTNPVFSDIYTPLEGFVANGGLKIKL